MKELIPVVIEYVVSGNTVLTLGFHREGAVAVLGDSAVSVVNNPDVGQAV